MLLRILPWAIVSGLTLFSVATYAGLPAEIPRHLNSAGEATRSVELTWMSWMLLPFIAAATQAFMTWLTLLLPSKPDLFSFAEKERFLKLPREYQGDTIVRMQATMDIIAGFTMLVLFAVQVVLWRTAMGHPSKNTLPFLMVGTIVFLPLALVLTSRVSAAANAAEKKWRAATGETDSRTSGPRSATDR